MRYESRQPALAGVAMQHDIFDDDDGIVNHQADRRSQSAQRHQVEALAQHLQRDESDQQVTGITSAGHHRCSPIAQEEHQMMDARIRPIKIASRTLLIDSPTMID